jgi:hypothetical protein
LLKADGRLLSEGPRDDRAGLDRFAELRTPELRGLEARTLQLVFDRVTGVAGAIE